MAKYRTLTLEELHHFEKEFVDFLVVNGIVAADWEQLKIDEIDKAMALVDLFSNVVFDQILKQTKNLEKHDPAVLQHITCLEDKLELIAIKRKSDEIDLTKIPLNEIRFADVEVIRGSKKYVAVREDELFDLILQGYYPTKGEGWNSVHQHLSKIKF